MATTNVVGFNVYQINQRSPIPLGEVAMIGFPANGVVVADITNSPTRYLSTGVNVYARITTPSGDLYYVAETYSQVLSAFNA